MAIKAPRPGQAVITASRDSAAWGPGQRATPRGALLQGYPTGGPSALLGQLPELKPMVRALLGYHCHGWRHPGGRRWWRSAGSVPVGEPGVGDQGFVRGTSPASSWWGQTIVTGPERCNQKGVTRKAAEKPLKKNSLGGPWHGNVPLSVVTPFPLPLSGPVRSSPGGGRPTCGSITSRPRPSPTII